MKMVPGGSKSAKCGPRTAFARFGRIKGDWDWEEAIERCRREAKAVLGDTPEADDAAQEAMLRAWRARDSCREAATRMAWVASITRREAFRLAKRISSRPEELGMEADLAGADNPMLTIEERLSVGGALHDLGSIDRQLIALRYAHDMTYGQAAQALGMPEGTAKVRLHRLHKRLAEILRESR